MTYTEKSQQLVLNAPVAVFVLANERCDDLEFLPLRPRLMTESEISELAIRWPERDLRAVGVIGIVGAAPAYAFKEPLEPEQTSALVSAFLSYLHGFFCGTLASQLEAVEIHSLARLWSLPDPRLEA